MTEGANDFAMASGRTLHLVAVNPLLIEAVTTSLEAEYRERGEMLDAPRYRVETVGGDFEEFTHIVDAVQGVDTLKDDNPEVEKANRATWAKYAETQGRYSADRGSRLMRVLLAQGVSKKGLDYPDGPWVAEQESLFIRLPSTEPDRFLHYLKTVACASASELEATLARITQLSLSGYIDEGRVQQALRLFRPGTQGNTAKPVTSESGVVDQRADIRGDAGSEGVAPQPVRVSRAK